MQARSKINRSTQYKTRKISPNSMNISTEAMKGKVRRWRKALLRVIMRADILLKAQMTLLINKCRRINHHKHSIRWMTHYYRSLRQPQPKNL